jgi:putative glutamine amidotransferase
MKPIIGVLSLYYKEKESIWMLPGYLDGIKNAGGIPIILTYGATK